MTAPHGSAFSGRLGWGARPALLVVDLVRAYTEPGGPFLLPEPGPAVAATAALWAAGQVRGFLWSVGASLVMGLAVTGMHYTGMAALSVHLHSTAAPVSGDSPASLLAPMMIGPLAFLLLAGVVVMFDPLMVMGKPVWSPAENKPGVPARELVHHPAARRSALRPRRGVSHRESRAPQNR